MMAAMVLLLSAGAVHGQQFTGVGPDRGPDLELVGPFGVRQQLRPAPPGQLVGPFPAPGGDPAFIYRRTG